MRERTLEHKPNTKIVTRQDWIAIRLHDTEIVKFNSDVIILDSGDWRTVTTKRRINQAARRYGLRFRLDQTNFNWFVQFPNEAPIPFYDGIKLSRDRTQPHPAESAQPESAATNGPEYNGWANRATWNVFLWLNNVEEYYRRYIAYRDQRGDFTPKSAYSYVLHVWPNGRTPDGDLINRANWVEIAHALNER